jgi:hypothetical protein
MRGSVKFMLGMICGHRVNVILGHLDGESEGYRLVSHEYHQVIEARGNHSNNKKRPTIEE